MESFNIYKNLARLNELPVDEADRLFFTVSGSEIWARELTRQRPYLMLERLFDTAENVWFSLPTAERIEAFGRVIERNGTSVDYKTSQNGRSKELEKLARLYREKFGFIFVLRPEVSSEAERLAVCRARLGNSAATELQIAAEEHGKLIESRLNEILEK